MFFFNIIPTYTMMCFFRRRARALREQEQVPAAPAANNSNTNNLAGDGPYPRPALNPTTAKKAHHDRDLRGHPDPLRSCPVEHRSPAPPTTTPTKEKKEDKKEEEEGEKGGGANVAGSVSQNQI